ncbi:MAG: DUF4097 family beta strand repeat-containing protein [Acidimicrobiia bacterium]
MSTVNREFTVGAGPSLNIRIQAGRVDVGEGPPGTITVEVHTRDPDSVEISQTGDTIHVSDNRSGWVVRGTVRVTATVPAGTDLEVGSASADVHTDAELGAFICRTASGDVAFRVTDSLEVKTASGSIRGDQVGGDVRVNSASGDVWIQRIGGRLTAALASGDVRTEEVGGDLRANSASGDLRIDRFRGDEVTLKSVSGDLVIGFPKGIRLEAEVNTLSGHVHLPTPASPEPPAPPTQRSGPDPMAPLDPIDSPKRRVRLNAKTVSGDIRISSFSD